MGARLKADVLEKLQELNMDFEDLSPARPIMELYPEVAKSVCQKVIDSKYKRRGILICGTGIGMSIVANKFKGIHAAVCHDYYSAERSILSNNINILCLGAKVIGTENAKVIVERWLQLEFITVSNSYSKLKLIKDIEELNFKNNEIL